MSSNCGKHLTAFHYGGYLSDNVDFFGIVATTEVRPRRVHLAGDVGEIQALRGSEES